jgi:translocation and assembly module TamB
VSRARGAAVLLFALLASALALAWWLGGTRGGLEALLSRAGRLGGGTLEIARVEGRLWGPLGLHGASYRSADGTRIDLGHVTLDWRVEDRALVLRLTAAQVRYHAAAQPAGAAPDAGLALPDITLPVALSVEHLEVTDLRRAGDPDALLDRLRFSGRGRDSRWRDVALLIERGGDRLELSGELGTRGDWPLELALAWHWAGAPEGPLSGSGQLLGSAVTPRLNQRLDGWLQGSLTAAADHALSAPQWHLEAELAAARLAGLAPGLADVSATFALRAEGDAGGGRAEGSLSLAGLPEQPLDARFRLAYRDNRLHLEELVVTEREGASRLRLSGDLDLAAPAPTVSATGELSVSARQLPGGRQLRSAAGDFLLTGSLDRYHLQSRLRVALDALPEAELEIAGSGDRAAFQAETLNLFSAGAGITGAAELGWAPDVHWRGAWQLRDLDPALFAPAWPGRLSGTIDSSGTLGEPLRAELRIADLHGEVRGLPASGSGAFALAGQQLRIDALDLRLGAAGLSADGTLGEHWQLRLAAEVPELGQILPEARGALRLAGELTGPRDAPRTALALKLADFHYQTLTAARFDVEASADLAAGGELSLNADGAQLSAGALSWPEFEARLRGTREQHALTLDARGTPLGLSLQATGGLAPDWHWRGELGDLLLRGGDFGDWALAAPAALAVGEAHSALQSLCLHSGRAELCLDAARDATGSSLDLHLRDLGGDLLGPWLPPEVALDTSFTAEAHWRQAAGGAPAAQALVRSEPGSLRIGGAGERDIPLGPGQITLGLDAAGLAATARLGEVAASGLIDAELRLPGWSLPAPAAAHQAIAGRLRLDTEALDPLAAWVAAIEEPGGRLHADLDFSGTLAAPRVGGELALSDGRVRLPELGIALHSIELRAQGAPDGRLNMDGSVISGEDFAIASTRELQLDVNPDLRATLTPELLSVGGEIFIPHARIEPQSLPDNARTVSADVRIRDGQEPEAAAPSHRLSADVALRLGKDVRFTGFGLSGRPAGAIRVIQEPGLLARASGVLSLEEGTYSFRGRPIPITRGRVVYADSPLDAPGIDLVAERKIDGVTAGLRLSGPPRSPQMALFSSPAMPDADILSYLLLGRPLSGTSAADAGLLMSAATSAGLARGDELAQTVGSQLGLEEMRIESEGGLETTALVLGRYLAPRIYVRYLAGLAGAGQRVQLNYEISDRLEWQVESGTHTGTDIFYTIERKPGTRRDTKE